MKIFINPGHQGHQNGLDCGAVGAGVDGKLNTLDDEIESEWNLTVGLTLSTLLQNDGFDCVISRMSDSGMSLNQVCEYAKKFYADINISIHHNAGGGKGAEIIRKSYPTSVVRPNIDLAQEIIRQFKLMGQITHGNGLGLITRKGSDKIHDYFAFNRCLPNIALITEFCFLDSSETAIWKNKLDLEAHAIYNGIKEFLRNRKV
jgi:N-acetylmuramoyl-L-alanine amidase